jgi:hypothetical protein
MSENVRESHTETKNVVRLLADEQSQPGVNAESRSNQPQRSKDAGQELFLGYEQHEAAGMYPLMQDEAFDGLCESLREIGLADPIVLHAGKVLEGRNRCRAIERLKAEGCEIEARFLEWEPKGDETPYDYVVAVNSNRRHLTPDQQAAAACKYLPHLREQSGKRQAATRFKAGRSVAAEAAAKNSEPPLKRDSRAKNASSTAGQLAAKFGISQHMANQAVALEKAVAKGQLPPSAVEEVLNGTKISKVLARVVEKERTPITRNSQPRKRVGDETGVEAVATPWHKSQGTPLDPTNLWGKPSPKKATPVETEPVDDEEQPRMFSISDIEEEVSQRWEEFLRGFPGGYVPRVKQIVAGILHLPDLETTPRGPRGRGSKKNGKKTVSSEA